MFLRIFRKSLSKRKTRITIAVISVIIGAAIAIALVIVSFDSLARFNKVIKVKPKINITDKKGSMILG